MRKRSREPWKIDLNLLTARQSSKYDDSLEVLRLMRRGIKFSDAIKEVGIGSKTVKKYVGSTMKIKNRILVPKSTDTLLRTMRIYENGNEVLIQIKGLKKASIIGKYHSAVGKLVDQNDNNVLDDFKTIQIRDIHRKTHTLETNRNKIFDIFDRREEPEFFTIYDR